MEARVQTGGIGRAIAGMWRLTRPQNGAITFLSIASLGVIAGIPASRVPELFLAAAAGFFMTAFGNASNDYLDVEIDKINRPGRPLPSGQITQTQALVVVIATMFLAVGIGFSLGPVEFLFITLTAAVLAGYNALLKRIPLGGNITVGVLTGAAFIFGGIAIDHVEAALFPALFAFVINTLRELLKDAEDIEGDMYLRVITFPKRYGMKATRKLAAVLAGLLIALTAVPYFAGMYNSSYAVLVLIGVDVPLVAGILYLWNHFSRDRISRVCILLKCLMVIGLLSIVIGSTTYIQLGS